MENETTFISQELPPETARAGKRALAFILAVVLLDVIGLTILFPVQAFIVRQYSDQALMVTLIPALYAAAQFIGAPVLGKLSDRYGRRPVLLFCLLGSAAGYFLFGLGGALWVLFLSRIIDGFSGGNISTASAYVADVTPPQERARSFGLVGAAFGFGFILGPAIGGALGEINLAAPAYAAGALSLLNAIAGYFVLPESLPKERRTTGPIRLADLNPFASIGALLGRPRLGSLLAAQAVFYLAFSGFTGILAVFAIERFSVLPGQLAALLAVSGIANVVVQAGLVGRLVKRFDEQRLAVAALVLQALAGLATALVPELWMMVPVMLLSSAGSGLFYPTIGALLANAVQPDEQGRMSGVSAALGSLMNLFGPLSAGLLYDRVLPAAPFFSGLVLSLLAALLLARARSRASFVV
jgi:multidrug resistance protein